MVIYDATNFILKMGRNAFQGEKPKRRGSGKMSGVPRVEGCWNICKNIFIFTAYPMSVFMLCRRISCIWNFQGNSDTIWKKVSQKMRNETMWGTWKHSLAVRLKTIQLAFWMSQVFFSSTSYIEESWEKKNSKRSRKIIF